ncbi:MAG: universal stress protein [Bacteroidetes bacterium]|nr:universal stress protein [Bacteroidota bacterium]
MKRILVPCDFSSRSREAYKTAMHWASLTGGEVIALYVNFIPAVYDFSFTGETLAFNPEYLSSMEQDAKTEFEKMKQEANFSSVQSRLEIVYGDVVFSIKNFVESNKMNMIIMGTSGSSGLEEIFIGSNTEKVVRHSPVPVLAVREYVNVSSMKKILFPTLMNLDQAEFMKKLKELQQFLNATLHVLFVNSPSHFLRDSDAKEAFDEFAKQYKLENFEFHFRNYRNEEEGVIDFTATQKIDLIVMATHARKGLAHLFNGSITEDVINHITSPVWTYALKKPVT